jgi:hypothetical protein
MSDSYKAREESIAKALNAFAQKLFKSAVACAREFDIPPRTFQLRLKIGRSKSTRSGITRLSEAQDIYINEYKIV